MSSENYYTFGALMPGRTSPIQTAADLTSAGTKPYRYGFNGKESDFEVKNIGGSQQDYGLRIYDPRLGKFLSVDPLTKDYPWYTPYQFAGNKPIQFIDLDGGEESEPTPPGGTAKDNTPNGTPAAEVEQILKGLAPKQEDLYHRLNPGAPVFTHTPSGTISTPKLPSDIQMSVQIGQGIADGLGGEGGGAVISGGLKLLRKGVQTIGRIEVPLYRSFGGIGTEFSNVSGKYFTPVNPALYGKNYAKFAGLPAENSGAFTIKVSTPLNNIEFGSFGLAKPIGNNTGLFVPEIKIINVDAVKILNLRVNWFTNPEYVPLLPIKMP